MPRPHSVNERLPPDFCQPDTRKQKQNPCGQRPEQIQKSLAAPLAVDQISKIKHIGRKGRKATQHPRHDKASDLRTQIRPAHKKLKGNADQHRTQNIDQHHRPMAPDSRTQQMTQD